MTADGWIRFWQTDGPDGEAEVAFEREGLRTFFFRRHGAVTMRSRSLVEPALGGGASADEIDARFGEGTAFALLTAAREAME